MTANRILQLNAIATAGCALGMLLTRSVLFQFFGATGPVLFDVIAVGLLGYAGALWVSARPSRINRGTLLVFTVADGMWVAGSAIVLVATCGSAETVTVVAGAGGTVLLGVPSGGKVSVADEPSSTLHPAASIVMPMAMQLKRFIACNGRSIVTG